MNILKHKSVRLPKFTWCVCFVFFTSFNPIFSQKTLESIVSHAEKLNRNAQYDSSIVYLKQEINQLPNLKFRGDLYLKLGKSYNLNDQMLEAFRSYREAEKIFNHEKNTEGKAKVYIAFIEFYRKKGNYNECTYYFNRIENYIKRNEISQLTIAHYYSRKSAVEQEKNQKSKLARTYSLKALKIAKKLNNNELIGTVYNDIAGSYEQEGNLEAAIQNLLKSLEYWNKAGNYLYITYELNSLARVEGKRKNYAQSKIYLKEGITYAEKYKLNSQKIYLYSILRDIYAIEENYKLAYEMQIKYDNIRYIIETENSEKILQEAEEKYNVEKQINITNTARRRAERAEQDALAKKSQSRLLIFFSILLLIFITIITILAIRLQRKNKELKSSNHTLNLALTQKNILFKELHHRVKNNLTILKSILFLQAKSSPFPEVKEALNESKNRIESMALVHDNLYEADDVSRVELKGFIQHLLFKLEDSIFPKDKKINFTIDEKKISMPVSSAIFIGFIINELVTNSMKYAVNEKKNLEIGVKLMENDDYLFIEYWDNGKGLSKKNIQLENGGFGFRLIHIMMKQLKSEMEYSIQVGKPTFKFKIVKSHV